MNWLFQLYSFVALLHGMVIFYYWHRIGFIERLHTDPFTPWQRASNYMTGFIVHVLLWPISVVISLVQQSNSRFMEWSLKIFRRTVFDRDDRFTQPQMPALCGVRSSLDPEPTPDSQYDYCVRPRRHEGKHSNRDPRVPHDDWHCPCQPREWTDEEASCLATQLRICALRFNHEGRCKTAQGEEFDPGFKPTDEMP